MSARRRRFRAGLSATTAFLVAAATVFVAAPAAAVPTDHEITARWAGDPAPTSAPYGQPVTAEWRINTNDATEPFANEDVENVRATLIAGNGVFTSIPAVCKTTGVDPVSVISDDGATLLCNVGTVREGTSTLIQSPVRASGTSGGNLTLSGTATSDSAVAEAGPADPGPLPITYTRGMDLSLVSAPGQGYQGGLQPSRSGGSRTFVQMNFSLILDAGSRPGPSSYSFPLTVGSTVAGGMTGFQWEGCVPVGVNSASTGQPYSDPAVADRTNFPDCTVSGSGANYTISLSNLDYTLVNTPRNDSLGQPLPGTGSYIASGTVQFSIPSPVTQLTPYTFTAAPGAFTFTDGVTAPDTNSGNNTTNTTLTPPGGFSNHWAGSPAASRSTWDANLWVSPGTGAGLELPQPGIEDIDDYRAAVADGTIQDLPLYMQANSRMWNSYQGAGGAQMAGVCTMNQNPAFVPTWVDGGGWDPGAGYLQFSTVRFFYTTAAIDTKTETCSDAAPSAKWVEVVPPVGHELTDPRIGSDILMQLPAGVTAVKMTWNPAIDRPRFAQGYAFLRVLGPIDEAAPTSGEGWTVGAVNGPTNPWPGFPTSNGWVNASTSSGGSVIPGSTYGPNTNGFRDAFRLQGPQGVISKEVGTTTAEPGVPVTYSLRAQAQNVITSPPPVSFEVVDTLPDGMEYVPGSGSPAPTTVNGRTLTWQFTNVQANVDQDITYRAQIPADGAVVPGTRLTNTAVINVPGDNRPATTPGRTANATVLVPSSSSTNLAKSSEDNLVSFFGDSSAWVLTVRSEDPDPSAFTDTIDVLPHVGDGRGTNIDGTYTVTGVTAPAGSTVYYTSAAPEDVSADPRDDSNGDEPGSVAGNTVGWSETAIPNPTAIRIIGPALDPGATQTIRIAFDTPAASSCEDPADGDNKPGQILVNSATSIAEHTELPMVSSSTTTIGSCYAVDLKKYVQDLDGVWHDANEPGDFPAFRVGDTVRYRIVVENVGQGTITNLQVTDDQQPELGSFPVESLARGESETHEYEVVLEAGGPDLVVNEACGSADTPADGEAPVILCDPAGITVDGDPTHEKSLISATPIGNGQWELVYGIDVTNTSTSATVYTLDDTLRFADDATIVSAQVTESPDGVDLAEPAWDGADSTRIATSVPLLGTDDTGYAAHHYEVTVVAEVPLFLPGAGTADDPTQCGADADDSNRAFSNTSALTDRAGEVEEDRACAPIPSIDIAKSVSEGPTPNGDGTWTVVYDIVATNAGDADGVYDVTDMMTADGDLVVESGRVITTPEGVTASPDWTGLGAGQTDPENLIAADVTLPAGGTHTYQVEVVLSVDAADGAPVVTSCDQAGGGSGGLSNTAQIEHNDLTDDAQACITVAFITVDKTVASGPVPNGDGTWTVVYEIVAENVGAAAGDYDVYDQLRFGEGIEIESTDITAPAGVTLASGWTGLGDAADAAENLIASTVTLDTGASHTYQVEVVVSMDEDTIAPSALQCPPPGSGASGGLANGTLLDHNGIEVVDATCPTLPLIAVDKSISDGPTGNGDGTWTITYDLTATNTGAAEGVYDIADELQFGEGIAVESAEVITTPEGVTAEEAWNGRGENLIAADVALEADGTHTYQVQVVVSLDLDVVTPASLGCPPAGSGEAGGLSNTVELTHNGETRSDEDCAPLPLIGTTKSLSGAVVPVEGEEGVYDATYEIAVSNAGPAAGEYDLDDRLAVGEGVTVIGVRDVTTDAPDSVGLNPDFGTDGDARIVTDQPIAAADGAPVVHTYTVVIRYAVDLSVVDGAIAETCTVDGGAAAGTLQNIAAVSWNGIDRDDDACLIPGKPTLDKELVSAEPAGEGQWTVVYDLTVGNTGLEATRYDLDDEFLFAREVTVDTVTVAGPEGVEVDDAFDGAENQRIATDVEIAGLDDEGYFAHVYTVTVVVDVPLHFADADADGTAAPGCTVAAGGNFLEQGLNNAATLTDPSGGTITDTDCAPLPSIDITKSIVGEPVQGEGGEWSVTYEIVATNDGAAAGDYQVVDRLRYGAGIEVTGARITEAPEGVTLAEGWTGLGEDGAAENVVADGTLPAGGNHTYRVVVTSTLDTDAADGSTLALPEPGSEGDGGFANSAVIVHNDLTDRADAGAVPEWPKDVPPPLAATGGTIAAGVIGTALALLIAGGILLATRRRRESDTAAKE
ncbi:hypothetical protein [Microbacterium sp. JZ31]|uniref:hypothetical protein n=1 Tax=Microbacterium sp. JZ31 TaxID=1906274 RepID=UPI001932CA7A|nr:hypothetical protein [Microbacterium sp. JZ31]